jgi:sialate O-acetylesterase
MLPFLFSLTLLLLWLAACSASELKLPTFVASHMVLQREPLQSRLWGWASPMANVTATLIESVDAGDLLLFQVFTIANEDGSWWLNLPPQPAGTGHKIQISDGITEIVLEDIAFGDVYLCSGQSNMQMSVGAVFNASEEIADSIHYPHLRLATVQLTTADTEQVDVESKANYTWARSGPGAMDAAGDSFSWYSASCYFFGREIYKSLERKVPIGLVTSCWGGQRVETFSSPDALADATCGGTRPAEEGNVFQQANTAVLDVADSIHDDRFKKEMFDFDQSGGGGIGVDSTQLWNAMIYPLLPMRFVGVVWYQGEANSDDATSYACRFPAMITDWRIKFSLPDLSLFYVQLAGFKANNWAEIRAAQDAALQLPGVGVAIASDLGDPGAPAGAIHPRRKQEVGRRLALNARVLLYGERDGLVYQGPVLDSVEFTRFGAILGFRSGTADGLHLKGTAECTDCCFVSPFEVLDSLGNWTRAEATIFHGQKIMLESTDPILGIRLNWEGYPQCAVYNGSGGPDDHAGLPAAPFEWCAYPTGDAPWTGMACATSPRAKRSGFTRTDKSLNILLGMGESDPVVQ